MALLGPVVILFTFWVLSVVDQASGLGWWVSWKAVVGGQGPCLDGRARALKSFLSWHYAGFLLGQASGRRL